MKMWTIGRPDLFEVPRPPIELSALQRAKALALLGALLTEAIVARTQQSQEVSDDEDHG